MSLQPGEARTRRSRLRVPRRLRLRHPVCVMIALAVAGLALLPACDGDWSLRTTGISPPAPKSMSLEDTITQLQRWHEQGAYTAMRPYIDAAQREDLIDLLVAVDELLAANASALRAVKTSCPTAPIVRCRVGAPVAQPHIPDLYMLTEMLDLFSPEVKVISHGELQDRSTVALQIGDSLPLAEVQFQFRSGLWVYLPGGEDPGIVPIILREVTRSLNQITMVVSAGAFTFEQIRREYELRLWPKLKQNGPVIPAATPEPPPALSDAS